MSPLCTTVSYLRLHAELYPLSAVALGGDPLLGKSIVRKQSLPSLLPYWTIRTHPATLFLASQSPLSSYLFAGALSLRPRVVSQAISDRLPYLNIPRLSSPPARDCIPRYGSRSSAVEASHVGRRAGGIEPGTLLRAPSSLGSRLVPCARAAVSPPDPARRHAVARPARDAIGPRGGPRGA